MAARYRNSDIGNDGNDGLTWATAKLTQEGLFSVMSAGDDGYCQGSAADSSGSSRTLTSPGTIDNPCRIVGVALGTTNEPPVESDLASTLPVIQTTGSADFNFQGFTTWQNIEITPSDKMFFIDYNEFIKSKLNVFDDFGGIGGKIVLIDSELDLLSGGNGGFLQGKFRMYGGTLTKSGTGGAIDSGSPTGSMKFYGVDMSSLGTTSLARGSSGSIEIKVVNCRLPSTFNIYPGTPTGSTNAEVIKSSNASSIPNTECVLDYRYENAFGSVEHNTSVVRTGGASPFPPPNDTDQQYSYALTPNANATREGTLAKVMTPMMPIWVEAGSQTITFHICNDGGVDYNEDEVFIELYAPNNNDTTQHEHTFEADDARLFPSTTPVADDPSAVWSGAGGNGQKFDVPINPGFIGYAYAFIHVTKRQATPDTIFVCPKPGVS